jgi:hypothetical protein
MTEWLGEDFALNACACVKCPSHGNWTCRIYMYSLFMYPLFAFIKVYGLQPNSVPPVWVLNKHTHLTLTDGDIRYLSAEQSSYAFNGDGFPSYTYSGMMKGYPFWVGKNLSCLRSHIISRLAQFLDYGTKQPRSQVSRLVLTLKPWERGWALSS